MPWQEACKNLGLKILDVRSKPRVFIRELVKCDRVLCEAMHGAILADAYGIPWQPIRAHPKISARKCDDWGSSIGAKIDPFTIPEAYLERYAYRGMLRVKDGVKRYFSLLGIEGRNWWRGGTLPDSTRSMFNNFQDALRSSQYNEFQLTENSTKQELVGLFDHNLRDYLSGK